MAKKKKTPSPITVDNALNARQNAFVFWYLTPGDTFYNATQSARAAGYKGNDNVLARAGFENLRKPKIASSIRARQRELFATADVSIDKVLQDIEMARQLAIREKNYPAAIRASELHGKYLKMFADKIEHLHTMDDVSTDDLVELAQSLAGKINGIGHFISTGGDAAGKGINADSAGDKKKD